MNICMENNIAHPPIPLGIHPTAPQLGYPVSFSPLRLASSNSLLEPTVSTATALNDTWGGVVNLKDRGRNARPEPNLPSQDSLGLGGVGSSFTTRDSRRLASSIRKKDHDAHSSTEE